MEGNGRRGRRGLPPTSSAQSANGRSRFCRVSQSRIYDTWKNLDGIAVSLAKRAAHIKILSHEWLEDCFLGRQKKDETPYLFTTRDRERRQRKEERRRYGLYDGTSTIYA